MCELSHSPINLLPMQSSKNKHYILKIKCSCVKTHNGREININI